MECGWDCGSEIFASPKEHDEVPVEGLSLLPGVLEKFLVLITKVALGQTPTQDVWGTMPGH